MKVAAPSSETGGANECLQRPSAPLPKTSSGDPDDHSERIKCVTLTAEIASAPEYCSNVDAYGTCPDSNNTWSKGAYTLDLACVDRAVNEGRWENDTFCSCAANYNLRFAARRILGECSFSKDECALDDSSCSNHLILQTEYSQYCSLEPRPPPPPPPRDPSKIWYPWTHLYVVVIVIVSSLVLLTLPLAIMLFNGCTRRPRVKCGPRSYRPVYSTWSFGWEFSRTPLPHRLLLLTAAK